MKIPRYGLKSLLIGTAAIGLLLTAWPPYRFQPGPFDEGVGFNGAFWNIAALELLVFGLAWLVRIADSARRGFDDPPTERLR